MKRDETQSQDRPGILAAISDWLKLLALVVLVLEAFLFLVVFKTGTAEWYVVILGVGALALIIIGLFYDRYLQSKTQAGQPLSDVTPGSGDHVDVMRSKVSRLKDVLVEKRFLPDVIVGVARGGVVIAAYLSELLGRRPIVPMVSLWPHDGHDNSWNDIDFKKKDSTWQTKRPINILMVDDICRSGHTLNNAKLYLDRCIGEPTVHIRTAAVSRYHGNYDSPISPNYWAETPEGKIRDALGEEEKP